MFTRLWAWGAPLPLQSVRHPRQVRVLIPRPCDLPAAQLCWGPRRGKMPRHQGANLGLHELQTQNHKALNIYKAYLRVNNKGFKNSIWSKSTVANIEDSSRWLCFFSLSGATPFCPYAYFAPLLTCCYAIKGYSQACGDVNWALIFMAWRTANFMDKECN